MSLTQSAAAAALVFAAVAAAPAQAQPAPNAVRAGLLSCNVSGGVGFVITSARALNCVYKPARGSAQRYAGTVRRFGLDIGVTGPGKMEWGVVNAQRGPAPRGALAGEYVGASAAATVGVGVSANALVGGNNRSFTLQPLSIEGQTGLSLAAGVGEMQLEPVAAPRKRGR